MTGSGTGTALGTGTLLGAGHLGGSPFAFTSQFNGWINGAPVITTVSGDFSSWANGTVFVDTGIRSPAPGPTGFCSGSAVLQGIKFGVGSGSGYCLGTGTLTASGALVGSGIGFCNGMGTLTGQITPVVGTKWNLRRVSPVQPRTHVYAHPGLPAWDIDVSPKSARLRQVSFS